MERDEQLIEAVRDYSRLYNSKSTDFKVLLKKRTPGLPSPPDCRELVSNVHVFAVQSSFQPSTLSPSSPSPSPS